MSALEELAAAVDSELQRAPAECTDGEEEEEEEEGSAQCADCSGSDTDSWTLLDEEEEAILKAEEETQQQPSKDTNKEEETQTTSPQPDFQLGLGSSSDNLQQSGDSNLSYRSLLSSISLLSGSSLDGPESLPTSVVSDGIPIAEDLSEDLKPQYLWNDDFNGKGDDVEQGEDVLSLLKEDKGTDPKTPDLAHSEPEREEEYEDEEEEEEEDETVAEENHIYQDNFDDDDIEVIGQNEIESIPHRPNDLSTVYPGEELPSGYAEIQKGQTYNHRRNQQVNLLLSGLVALVVAMVLGLGVGHFLGWSERLELQEMYAGVREEKMEELTGNLVNCMTGPEAEGGDDQDLDDRVIQHLYEENRNLREELDVLKKAQEDDDRVEEEMSVILFDRVNDLLAANVKLEQELERLQQQQKEQERKISEETQSEENLQETLNDLQETKDSLNQVVHENEQLKIAIGKARYAAPTVPLSEKEKINLLQTENDELKKAVRQYRYAPVNLMEGMDSLQEEEKEKTRGGSALFALPSSELSSVDGGIFDGLKFMPLGNQRPIRVIENENNWIANDDDDDVAAFNVGNETKTKSVDSITVAHIASLALDPEEEAVQALTVTKAPLAKFASAFTATADDLFKTSTFDPKRGLKAINKLYALLEKHNDRLVESDLKTLHGIESEFLGRFLFLREFVSSEAAVRHPEPTANALARLGKAFISTVDSVARCLDRNSVQDLAVRKVEFTQKWSKILDKYERVVKGKEATQFVQTMQEEESEAEPDKAEIKLEEKEAEQQPLLSKAAAAATPSRNNETTSAWMFERAHQRTHVRKEERRSEWQLERANNRKRLHDFNSAEWSLKKALHKDCYLDETDGEFKCDDLSKVNIASTNHGKKAKKEEQKRGEDKVYGEKYARMKQQHHQRFHDLDDDDDDDDVEEYHGSSWRKSNIHGHTIRDEREWKVSNRKNGNKETKRFHQKQKYQHKYEGKKNFNNIRKQGFQKRQQKDKVRFFKN